MPQSPLSPLLDTRLGTLPDSVSNPAKWMHERLVKSIIDFEKTLDSDLEIGARWVSFSGTEVVHIEDLGYWGPDLVIFHGTNLDGLPTKLLQHVTQVSVMLVAVPKVAKKPRRIGFDLQKQLEASSPSTSEDAT